MKRFSRVLCAVDLGEPGRAAFAQALALARAHDAKLIIVYAVPPTQSFNTGATERLAYLLKLRAAAEAAGLEVRITSSTEMRVKLSCFMHAPGSRT